MSRFLVAALVATLSGSAVTEAAAVDLPGCLPHARHHRHVAFHRGPPRVVYGRAEPRLSPSVYNHEDNGAYDGADLPPPRRPLAYGQPPSWLDGYGTRPVVYGAYGTSNVYGGSSLVWPYGIGPAGGLGIYSAGAYGPGPSIIEVPNGY